MTKCSTPRPPRLELKNSPKTKERLAVLGAIQYSLAEVAEDLGYSEAEVIDYFASCASARDIFHHSRAEARRNQRAAQFKLAEKSPTLAIFLGKQYLGQAERRESDASLQAARAAEAANDAGFVRNALATLAAARGAVGDRRGGEDGAG